jgi:TIR domain
MKFVHAADLHIDSPLCGLERYEGAPVERVRGATTRRALENLVELCLAEDAAFLLLAGDIFDGDWKDYGTGLFFVAQMARLPQAGTTSASERSRSGTTHIASVRHSTRCCDRDWPRQELTRPSARLKVDPRAMSSPEPYRPKVFISYCAREPDRETAASLRIALEKNEVRVTAWRDREDIELGEDGIAAIQQGIEECDFLLALISPRAVASFWCPKERARARRLEKTIIPVMLEAVPDKDQPLDLEQIQYLDFKRGLRSAVEEGEFHNLLQRLGIGSEDVEVVPDRLDRDADRFRLMVKLLNYAGGNLGVNAGTGQILVNIVKEYLETPRAVRIADAAPRAGTFRDCREIGEWLMRQWNDPRVP